MSDQYPGCRLAAVVLAGLVAGGCTMFRHEARPVTPSAAAPAAPAPSAVARAPLAAPPASATAPSAAPSATAWGLVAFHLDPAAMVGQTWVFPSASPVLYGDNHFAFRRDRLEASNAREHATGTWSVERDKLCVTLNSSAWGSACYYVTGSQPGGLQIRVLPDGDRVPLKIQ